MQRILTTLLFILAFATVSRASHSFVACSGTCTNSGVVSSLTVPASGTLTFTAAHSLYVWIRGGHGITINTPTSSPSETWTCGATVDPGVSLSTITLCHAYNIAGGSYTITTTTSGSTNLHIAVDEVSGTPTTCDPIQGSQVTTSVTTAQTITSNSITTTGTTSLLAGTGTGTNVSGWTPGANMTQRASISSSGRIGSEDRLNVSAGSYTPAQSWSSSNTDASMIVVAIIQTCPAAAPRKRALVVSRP